MYVYANDVMTNFKKMARQIGAQYAGIYAIMCI